MCPYKAVENMVELALQVTPQDKRPPIIPGIPPMLATIMQACWHREPLFRPTFKVQQCLHSTEQHRPCSSLIVWVWVAGGVFDAGEGACPKA